MQSTATSQIEELASRVMADIRDRGLVSGDRYLTAAEVRDKLGVSKNLVNDALKLLAAREVLIRRQRAGTFIGPRFAIKREVRRDQPVLQTVHVLMPMDYYRANIIPGSVFVDQISRVLPGVTVQLHHIADDHATAYTLDLIKQFAVDGRRDGLILLRSTREAQRAVQASGLPAVVFGSTYPDIDRLCSIDTDQYQAGRLAAEAALARGHERFALIMRNTWRRGDNLLMEGFSAELGRAGIGIDRVRVLSTPEDAKVIEHDVDSLLGESPRPTVLFCRSRFHADAAIRGVRDRGLEPGRDVLVICLQGHESPPNDQVISIKPTLESTEQVAKVGALLREIAEQGRCSVLAHKVAVELSGA